MRYKIFDALNYKSMAFWNVTSCGITGRRQHSEWVYSPHCRGWKWRYNNSLEASNFKRSMRGAKKTSVCMSEFVLRNHRRSDSVQHRRDAISAASLTHHPAPPCAVLYLNVLGLITQHAKKMSEEWGKAPHSLQVETRWRRVVRFVPRNNRPRSLWRKAWVGSKTV